MEDDWIELETEMAVLETPETILPDPDALLWCTERQPAGLYWQAKYDRAFTNTKIAYTAAERKREKEREERRREVEAERKLTEFIKAGHKRYNDMRTNAPGPSNYVNYGKPIGYASYGTAYGKNPGGGIYPVMRW